MQHAAEEVAVHPLKVVKVPFAAKWTARLREGVEGADAAVGAAGATSGTTKADSSTPVAPQQLSADWTFSSDYVCTLLCSDEQDGGACLSNRGVVVRARELPSTEGGAWDRAAGDSFRAIGMLGTSSENGHKEGAADTSAGTWRIESAADSGVDYTMLRRQDEPILFYDECVLYQVIDCAQTTLKQAAALLPFRAAAALRSLHSLLGFCTAGRSGGLWRSELRGQDPRHAQLLVPAHEAVSARGRSAHPLQRGAPLPPFQPVVTDFG